MAAVVVDAGSGFCKAGFSGEDAPRAVFPSVVGRLRHHVVMVGVDFKDRHVGDDALAKRGMLHVKHPIDRGVVVSWEDMEDIWSHIFYNELEVSPEDYPVLVAEPPMNPKANREEMTRRWGILFENFHVPAVHIAVQAVLSLYSAGRTTGLVVESGHGITSAVPVCEGYLLPHAALSSSVAGRALSEFFEQLLCERGFYFNSSHERDILQDMKEKLCWVALDFEAASQEGYKEVRYEMPGGSLASIGCASFRCPELLFQPGLASLGARGLPELTLHSILKCNTEVQGELFSNIVLAGGSTLFPGLPERLAKELNSLSPPDATVKVVAPAQRHHGAWLGGATISSVSAFQQMWLTSEEYDDSGPGAIHERCTYQIQ